MEKFLVEVRAGTVTNVRKGTSRRGYWIPIQSLPRDVATQLGADKDTARKSLAWDTHARNWRDMSAAKLERYIWANAAIVTMDDGTTSIALLDF